jgi:hypothetical protein
MTVMKKIYEKPQMEVVQIGVSQFLCTSKNSGEFGAPEFNPDDYDWVEKSYKFGGWELEEG